MKRNMLTILVVIVVAGLLGTLIQRDPGYVLVTYDGYSLQTSLWVGTGLVTALVLLLYYGSRLLRVLLNSTGYFSEWNLRRRQNRAVELANRGQLLFQEADYARARKFLEKSATNHRFPAGVHLLAAETADYLGDATSRESHLRLAAETGTAKAANMLAARLSARRGDWQLCLSILEQLPVNDFTMALKRDALLAVDQVDGIVEALPTLRKVGDVDVLEKRVAIDQMNQGSVEDVRAAFRKLPADMKVDEDVVLKYCHVVGEKESEDALRNALQKNWQRSLLLAYGQLGTLTLTKRLSQAKTWLQSHRDDADLHLLLGLLFEKQGQRDLARDEFGKSLAIRNSREANERMAGLLSFAGDYSGANEYLKAALRAT